jgi:hypothetical protein
VGKPPTFRVADRIRFDGHVEAGVHLAHAILHRLRFSSEETERVQALVANHMKFKDLEHMRDSTLKRFLRLSDFREHRVKWQPQSFPMGRTRSSLGATGPWGSARPPSRIA